MHRRELPPIPTTKTNTLGHSKETAVHKENENRVPIQKYNELLQKYEALTLKHSQQIMYVSALEEMLDVERKKVAELNGEKSKKSKIF